MPGSQSFTPDPRNDGALIYLNGELVHRKEAKVSIFDGGFVVGDGVWEGLRMHKGALLFLDQHLDRLYWGANKIALNIGLSKEELTNEIWVLLNGNKMETDVHIRLMVTRGEKTGLNQDPRNALGKPTIAMAAEYKLPDPGLRTQGLSLHTSTIKCSPKNMFDMRLNSHSRLNLIGALLEAIDAGADEALMLDPHDYVSSCNATNFFFVKEGQLCTSKGEYCFHGVTRANVIALAQKNNIPLQLDNFRLDEVHLADEAFVTGTFGGITPVRSIDKKNLSNILPGPITSQLQSLYESLKDEQSKKMTETIRIAMWSGPRNISTAMMRSFGARKDTVVIDEPFYAVYLLETGIDHPMREESIASQPHEWEEVVKNLLQALPANEKSEPLFFYQKHMTHHMLPTIDLTWLSQCRNAFLIRDPRLVIASYIKKREEITLADIGLVRQWEIFEQVRKETGKVPPVIDGTRLLENPSFWLEKLCSSLDIPFTEQMLSWPTGKRDTDGAWAPVWYHQVEQSTCFSQAKKVDPAGLDLPTHLSGLIGEAMPYYERMSQYHLS